MLFKLGKYTNALFFRYLVSYLIIFLIPFLTISAIFYYMSVSNLREEIVQSNFEKIEQVRDYTDTRLRELENIATRISLNHRLTPYMIEQPYHSKEAIEELISYKVNSSIIDALYLYYHDDINIYSSNGTRTIESFKNSLSVNEDVEQNELVDRIGTLTRPVVLPVEMLSENKAKQSMIAYFYSIPPNNTYAYGNVIFLVKQSKLTTLIKNVLGDFSGNIYVFNENNELLASSNNGKKLDIEEVKSLTSEKTSVVTSGILDDEKYSLIKVKSDVSNWTFVTAMPEAQFFERMASLKKTITLILLIIALIGLTTTVWMSIKQYRPIQSLVQLLKLNKGDHPNRKHQNEFVRIREKIELLHEDSEQLQQRILKQQPFIRDQFLLKLLNGNDQIQKDLKELSRDLQITFNGSQFFILMVSFKEKIVEQESLQSRERVLQFLKNVAYQGCTGYGVELIHDNAVGIIVNVEGDYELAQEKRVQFVSELELHLKEYVQIMPTIGVGEIYEGLDRLNRSFIEAKASIENNVLTNPSTINYFENLNTQNDQTLWYPANYHAKLVQSMKQGDQTVAKETLKSILYDLRDKREISNYLLRCMCFDMMNIVLKSSFEVGLVHSTEEIKSLVEFDSLDVLEGKMNHLIDAICQEVQTRKNSNNIKLRDDILKFIHEQYKNHDLSLESIAEEFQLSTSYISRFMKEQTGETFTQYVWELRKNEIMRRLIETDLPIKEIIVDVGYIDVANFTRKFKKAEGLTPGQYRKKHQFDQTG